MKEVSFKYERQFSNELGGSVLINYGELVNFTPHLCKQRLDTFLPTREREVLWRM